VAREAVEMRSDAPRIFRFRANNRWILTVHGPLHGIIQDVVPDAVQRFVVADDVIKIISLPNPRAGRAAVFVDPFGSGGFERSDRQWMQPIDVAVRTSMCGASSFGSRGDACVAPTCGATITIIPCT